MTSNNNFVMVVDKENHHQPLASCNYR